MKRLVVVMTTFFFFRLFLRQAPRGFHGSSRGFRLFYKHSVIINHYALRLTKIAVLGNRLYA